jgi:hypothetical protein
MEPRTPLARAIPGSPAARGVSEAAPGPTRVIAASGSDGSRSRTSPTQVVVTSLSAMSQVPSAVAIAGLTVGPDQLLLRRDRHRVREVPRAELRSERSPLCDHGVLRLHEPNGGLFCG